MGKGETDLIRTRSRSFDGTSRFPSLISSCSVKKNGNLTFVRRKHNSIRTWADLKVSKMSLGFAVPKFLGWPPVAPDLLAVAASCHSEPFKLQVYGFQIKLLQGDEHSVSYSKKGLVISNNELNLFLTKVLWEVYS